MKSPNQSFRRYAASVLFLITLALAASGTALGHAAPLPSATSSNPRAPQVATNTPTPTSTPCGGITTLNFAPYQNYGTGILPFSIALGDFNGDGIRDLAVANVNSNSVSVLLGNGDGTFQTHVDYTVGTGPASVAVGDFNGDGKLDLAVANQNSNTVSILLGNGNGTFQTHVDYAVGSASRSVAAGDFNGDGKLDLATANQNSNNVSILLGNGNGTFQTHVDYAVGSGPFYVAVGDFNGDSKLDLAVANFSSNNVSILLGNGNGTFQTHVDYAVSSNPDRVLVGDFNGDGMLDLAVVSISSNYVSILLNTSTCTAFTPTSTNTPTNTPTNTSTPTNTPAPTDTPGGPTDTPIAATATPTNTSTPTDTPTDTSTPTNTPAPTETPGGPTDTPAPPTSTPLATDTPLPTNTPGGPTDTPSAATPTPTDCANPFADVNGNVFYTAIHYLNCRGVINGTDATHYSPAGTSTRGQFAKVVVLGFGIASYTPTGSPDFSDVPTSYFAYLYIESGFHAGILSGFDQASCQAAGQPYPCYLPNRPITRGQLTKLVVNAAHYPFYTPTSGPTFADVPPSNVFFVSIETAHYKGVINGYIDHTFRPNNNIRRDEMAQIVYKGVTTP